MHNFIAALRKELKKFSLSKSNKSVEGFPEFSMSVFRGKCFRNPEACGSDALQSL
jgi:hypothetical protein